jgi:hypothetical protein
LRSRPKRRRRRYPQFKFDSTLGYPSEGPAKIASYNINGAKNKIQSVLREARREGIDALLLPEINFYAGSWHSSRLGLSAVCNRLGWSVFACHGNSSDVSAGCAVVINNSSRNIRFKDNKNPKKNSLNGRFVAVEVEIEGVTTWLTSSTLTPTRPKGTLISTIFTTSQILLTGTPLLGGISTASRILT